MLPAGGIEPISGTAISAAQEALKTGVIGRRTVTTYHYAKKDIVEEDSFTFRLWEAGFVAIVGVAAHGLYTWQQDKKADKEGEWDWLWKGPIFKLFE